MIKAFHHVGFALQISKLSLHPIEGEAPEELQALSEEELEALQEPDVLSKRIALLEAQRHELRPNLGAIAEYRKKVKLQGPRIPEGEISQPGHSRKRGPIPPPSFWKLQWKPGIYLFLLLPARP